MPPVIVATVALAGGLSVIPALGLTFYSALSIASVAVSAYQLITAKKPVEDSLSNKATENRLNVRHPLSSRKMVYGQARVGGTVALESTSGSSNKYLHLIVMHASHECESITDHYLDDKPVSDWDKYATLKTITVVYQNQYTRYPPDSNMQITVTDSSGSRVYLRQSISAMVSAYNGGESNSEIVTVATGKLKVTGNSANYDFDIAFQYDDEDSDTHNPKIEIVTPAYEPYRIITHLGADDQTADATCVQEVEEWDTTCRLRGIAYSYIRFTWNAEVWGHGVPRVSALVKGRKVYDYRDTTTAWTDNSALNIADFLRHKRGGNVEATEIDTQNIIDGANACDELVDLADGSQQKRYTLDGVVNLSDSPDKTINDMITSMAGSRTHTQGVYKIFAGIFTDPVKILTVDELAGNLRVRAKASAVDSYNAVKGLFVDADSDYLPTEFPAVTNDYYEELDYGGSDPFVAGANRKYIDVDFPFTTNSIRSQRLAKIMLEQSRQGITVEWVGNLSNLDLECMDTVRLKIDALGWSTIANNTLITEGGDTLITEGGDTLVTEASAGKIFKVRSWEINSNGGVDMTLTEEASGIYDWNLGEETTFDLAPNSNLPDPFTVDPPTSFFHDSGDERLLIGKDGTIITRWYLSFTPPSNSFIVGYDIQWRVKGVSDWTGGQSAVPEYYVIGVVDGLEYEVRARSVNSLGIKSDWLEGSHTVLGKLDPPPDVNKFLVSTQADGTRVFTWTLNDPPADLAGYKVRYIIGGSGTWETMIALHDGVLTSSPFETNLISAGLHTIAIKAVDTTGNESVNAKVISFTLPDPRFGGAIQHADFKDLGWNGTLTNAWISGDNDLHAKDQKSWADFAIDVIDWDNWTTWARDPFASISYEHVVIDVGTIVKFRPLVTVDAGATATVLVEEAHSDDDISYTSFATVDGSEVEARYIKIKITVTEADPINNLPTIDSAYVIISAQAISEDFEDLDTSGYEIASQAGHILLPIQNSYTIIKRVDVVLQNVGSGWTWELISKDDGGGNPQAEIKIYNGSGTLANATIDSTVRGL